MVGLEPTRACARLILSQLRLPFRHIGNSRELEVRGQRIRKEIQANIITSGNLVKNQRLYTS